MESLNSKVSNAVFIILIIISFLTPLFFLPYTFISPQYSTSLLFALGVVASFFMYILGVFSTASINLPTPAKYFYVSLIAVPAVYALSGLVNGIFKLVFFGYTFDISTVGFNILCFVYLFLVSLSFVSKKKIFYSYFAFVTSSIFVAIFVVVRIFFSPKLLSFGIFNSITSNTVGSWNNLGIFFGICLILSLLTYELAPISKFMKIVLGFSTIVSLFFLAIINFTIIWEIIAVFTFIFIIFSFINYENYNTTLIKRILTTTIFSLLVFALSIIFIIWSNSAGIYLSTKLKIDNLEIRPSFSATLDVTKNIIINKPLLGTGPNSFVNGWLVWRPDDVLTTVFWNTDFSGGIGLLPTYATTTGIIGIISWIFFLIYYVFVGIKTILLRQENKFLRYLSISSFFVSLYLWIMTIVYIPSISIYILTFYFTGLFFSSAFLSGTLEIKRKSFVENKKKFYFVSLFLILFIVGGLYIVYYLYRNTKSLWYFQKSSLALNIEKNNNLSEEYILKAISLVPHDVYYRALSEIELVKLESIVSQDVNVIKPEVIEQQFSLTLKNAIKAGVSAKDSDPANYLNWLSLGKVYEAVSLPQLKIKGAYDNAISYYSEALKRNPKNPSILISLSRLTASQGDFKKAKEYASQAIQFKKNYLEAYFILSQIEVAMGNIRGAIDVVNESATVDSSNPAIYFQLGLLKYNVSDWSGAIVAFEKALSIASDYANAKYFLGLSYELTGMHAKAIKEFQDLRMTNPDSKEVESILKNLLDGKTIFTNNENKNPEKRKTLPIKER